MSILECMGLMDFSVCGVEGVCYDMDIYQVFACAAFMQSGSSTVHWFCENLVSDLIGG